MQLPRRRPTSRRHGISIIEILVAAAIIAMLVAILTPALSGAREGAWLAQCASNQAQIIQVVYGNRLDHGYHGLPDAGVWFAQFMSRADHHGSEVVFCPKDRFEDNDIRELQGYYAVRWRDRYGTQFEDYADPSASVWSTIKENMNSPHRIVVDANGNKMFDGNFEFAGGQQGNLQWPERSDLYGKAGEITEGRFEFGFEADASATVDIGEKTVHINYPSEGLKYKVLGEGTWYGPDENGTKWKASGDVAICYDRDGNGASNWESEIVSHLHGAEFSLGTGYGGNNEYFYPDGPPNFPISVPLEFGGLASYGMNNGVKGNVNGDRIVLLDYNRLVATVEGSNPDLFDEEVAPRHGDRCNVTTADGAVTLKAVSEIDPLIHLEKWQQ